MADSKTQIIISAKDETLQAFNKVRSGLLGLGSLATSIGVGGFALAIKSAADFADEVGKAAQKVGITTEALSGLKYAADLSDVSFEGLQTGLKKLSVNMLTAAQGGKEAQDAFKLVGVNVKDSAGNLKSADAVLKELSDRFAAMPDSAEKTAIAVKLLGKSGTDLIPLLNGGSKAIGDMADEADRFGLVITSDAARSAEVFNDNLTRMDGALRGLKQTLGNAIIPALAQISDAMADAAKEGGLLHAVLEGLKETWAIAFDIDGASIARDQLAKINQEVKGIQTSLAAGKHLTAFGEMKMSDDEIQTKLKRLRDLGYTAARLQAELNPVSSSTNKGKVPEIVDESAVTAAKKLADDAARTAQRIYDQKLSFFKGSQEELAKTILSFQAAGEEADSDPSAKLQKQLDGLRALDPAMQTYLQGLVDITRQKELDNRQSDLSAAADDRELAALEEQSAAEQAALQQREDAFTNFYQNLISENEDLNVSLLTSDKKRAHAQLQLEHERAIARINGMGLESEQAEQLLDQETANFELRMKSLVTNGKDGFDELKRAIEGFGDKAAETFLDFAFDGKSSFKDVADAGLREIARLALKRNVTDPLFAGLDGGDFGDFFKGLLPSFAVGTDYVPNDMIAKIHKGERIVPAAENRGGGSASNVSVSVNVDASGSSVQGSSGNAAELGRAIAGAVQAELLKQSRPGALLSR